MKGWDGKAQGSVLLMAGIKLPSHGLRLDIR
jgi:hypothetical protein